MMDGFEDITYNLTPTELDVIIPIICRSLSVRIGETKAITNTEIQKGLYDYRCRKYRELHQSEPPKGFIKKYDGPRIRLMIRYIRVNNLVPRLASSSNGYWVEPDDAKLKAVTESIMHRAQANYFLARRLQEQMREQLESA
jgi:hypothetical protein